MWDGVIGLWRQIWRQQRGTVRAQRSVRLGVTPLEERVTPAVNETLLLPIQPPVTIVVSALPPAIAPAPNATTVVRSDLYGVGDAGQSDQVDDWEQYLTETQADAREPVALPESKPQADADADDAGAMIVEQPAYLPPIE
ncbi:MAG: hypothetical protein HYR84_10985 [Planctomycetes bacterium]|nr:hypothetical protein [Planctomycetota bacterium]